MIVVEDAAETLSVRADGYRLLAAAVLLAVGCLSASDPRTPQEASARGDQLLRKMSDTLSAAQNFSFTVNETHTRPRRNGEKEPYSLTRQVIVRRPNRLWAHTTGSDNRDVRVTYDGSTVTVVGDAHKIYSTISAPATLDETLELVSERYDPQVAVADFLYSSPYDSFADSQAEGGWVKRTTVNGHACEEMVYKLKAVDLTLSVTSAEPVLPCQADLIFRQEPGMPTTRLVFSDWNLQLQTADSQFVANVPQGYEQIPNIERIPKTELKADDAKAMGAASGK